MPGSSSTKAPKSVTRVTLPRIRSPAVYLLGDGVPGMGLQLLHAERDALAGGFDLQDLGVDLLADRQDVGGFFYAAPCDVADVEEAVDSTDVDEGSVVGEAAHGAGDDVAFLDLGVAAFFGGAIFFFGDGAAIDDDVFFLGVELDDAAADLLADEFFYFGCVAGPAARTWHKGADADVYAEAALDDCGDGADDDCLVGEGPFERGPIFGGFDAKAGEFEVALFVAAFYRDEEFGAGLDCLLCVLEDRYRQDAFGFETDVDEDEVGGDCDDCSGDLLAAFSGAVRVALLKLREDGIEGFG